ncbi:protein MIZU-KUSSEI 1-like [Neltuma alba]|uniref:protein MIZU-KUSSEI 1 n=1 Tax=Neltuma alba TaxID=207710 RepID=UPI0010A51A3A|nr:protein MIZU-KUSSEI 1-like [Prosopis alba]XP_028792151.1 protein MIZU-KUSSEI 1-like [Prosopis alba]
MKTIMAKSPHDSSFSFSRRYFHFNKKLVQEDDDDIEEQVLNITPSSHHFCHEQQFPRKNNSNSVSRFKSALTLFTKSRSPSSSLVGTRVVGTLFGNRRGRAHIAFQEDPKSHPPFLIELPTPTSVLVREMASGLVRIALECEKKKNNKGKKSNGGGSGSGKLVEEPVWRSYCNGRKCGYASRVECGEEEWKILKAVEPISMGAGVIPATCGGCVEGEGEVMYMRARFERVVGSKDSEAYYLMNPDGSGGPELSIYLLRV